MDGQRISHYEIEALLGEGAMGRVYRARDVVLERRVAIKLVSPHAAKDPTFMERFLREARLAAHLNHPNIATVYEFGEEDGKAFLVMELVNGETLARRLRGGPLPAADVRRYGAQAASALAEAHAAGIVHRDIKPGNLMFTRGGLLKVMDFGIARRAGDAQLTKTGSMVGTPKTMAPEILRGLQPGPASDLFSLGCVLFEALAGRAPFDGDDTMTVLYQIAQQEPPSLHDLRPDVPAELVAIVEGLLVKDPARRLGPAAAVAAALAGAAAPSQHAAPPAHSADETLEMSHSDLSRPADTASGAGSRGTERLRSRRFLVPAVVAFVLANLGVFGGRFVVQRQRALAAAARATAIELNDRGARLADPFGRDGIQHAPPDSVAAAQRLFEAAIRSDPKYAVPWNNLGDLARQRNDLAGAERDLRRALELDTSYVVARLNLAGVLEQAGQSAAAEREYRHAMEQDSTQVAAPNNLARLLTSQGRGPEAIAVLEPALRRWPDVAPLWKNYGQALLDTGRMDAADSALSRSLDLAPGQEVVIRNLMKIARERGRAAEQAARLHARTEGRDPAFARRMAALLDSLSGTVGPSPVASGALLPHPPSLRPRPSHPRVQRPTQAEASRP